MKKTDNGLPLESKVLLVLVGMVTVAWIIGAVVLACHLQPSDGHRLNEWGDFIAGASAPLAFLWLVVAVILQSRELREQRNELALTRWEFENHREVMRAQAEEARKHVEMIATQTKLLLQAEDEREFLAKVGHLATRLRLYGHIWKFESDAGKLVLGPTNLNEGNDLSVIIAVVKAIRARRLAYSNDKVALESVNLSAISPLDWSETFRVVKDCLKSKGSLTGSALAAAELYPLEKLREDMQTIETLADNLPR